MKHMKLIRNIAAATVLLGVAFISRPALAAPTPYVMSTGNYSLDFADIANWSNNFTAGIGAANWGSVAVNASGTVGDGVKISTSTATFSTSSSGGVQKGTGNILLLSTSTANSCAIDLYLDFTGRNAGTVSFDVAEVNNSTGDRDSKLQLFYTTDGTTFTEITGTSLPFTARNNVTSSAHISVTLPGALTGVSSARLRFYERSTTTGTTPTGSQPKISIDNVAVTSTGASGSPPVITGITPSSIAANAGDTAAFAVTSTGDPANYYWYFTNASGVTSIPTATTATLTLPNVVAAKTGGYFVVLSNATPPMATSSVVTLTVVDPYLAADVNSTTPTRLVGVPTTFAVSVKGTQPLSYQWYVKPTSDSDFTGLSPLGNGGTMSGATTNILSISSVAYSDATNYFVIASNGSGSVTSSIVTLTVASTASLAFWNFNGVLNPTNPVVAQGVGTAWATNCSTFTNNVASGLDYGAGNSAWGSATYPAVGASNKTAGVRFNVSTVGAKNIVLSYDTRTSATASKYERLQYSTNGTDFIDYPVSSSFSQNSSYESRAYSLAGFPGVANNPSFAVRIVTEFESTAKYGASANAQYVGNPTAYATSGTVSYDLVNLVADAITNANTVPTITSSTNVATTDIAAATVLNFTVGDAETAAGSLVVSATSSNQTVLPDGNIVPGGSGSSRTLTITPSAGALGVAPVLVTVTDGNGDSTVTWFYFTVTAGNQPPTITGLVSTNVLGNGTNTYSFTVGDDQTAVGSLTVSALSGNSTLVPNDASHLYLGGSGASRTVTVVPVPGQYGVVPITVTVNDGVNDGPATFYLEIRPNTAVLAYDAFDYDNAGAIINVSAGYWQSHSGTAGQMSVGSGAVTVTDALGEDCNAPLIGQPYNATNKQVLYSSFTLNFSAVPTITNVYFGHFKDNTSGGFYGRIYATAAGAASGLYRIGIGNASATTSAGIVAQDLTPGVNYTVVSRLVMTNGVSTIWINPTTEASSSVTDPTVAGAPSPVVCYALRESAGEGTLTIDNLKVGLNFLSVMTNIVDVAPVANADSVSVTENTTNNLIIPLANDVLNTPLGTLVLVSVSPTNGTATISGTNVLFTPTNNFVGTATIGYTIVDGFGGTSTSLITVAVTNIAPVANPDAGSVAKNSLTNLFTPLTNDVVNTVGGSLSIVSASPANGTVIITNGGQQLLFTPTTGFVGSTTIGYTISDGIGGTASSTITVSVVDTAPPVVHSQFIGGNFILSWDDPSLYLQSSTNVEGPYSNVPGATSPFTNDTVTVPTLFFRLTSHGPPAS